VAIALGYLAYTRFVNRPVTGEERELRQISRAYDAALSRFGQANRTLGTSGLDTTADLADSVSAVESLKKQLEELIPRLKDEKASSKARDLASRMEKFLADRR
jgi:hypothetical protein